MKVVEVRHIEDCFDGSHIREILFDRQIEEKDIISWGEGQQMQYFPHFARPFFKIRIDERYDIKGISGNKTMRVHLFDPDNHTIDDFIADI